MVRFWFVFFGVGAIFVLTLLHDYGIALTLGIVGGVIFFLRGTARGGQIGNVRRVGQETADIDTRLGVCFAAAGIAGASIGHQPPFPHSFQILYLVFQILACLGAIALSGRVAFRTKSENTMPK